MSISWKLEFPGHNDFQTPYEISCSGWLYIGNEQDRIAAIALFWGVHPICVAQVLRRRDDVNGSQNLEPSTRTGFRLAGNAAGLIKPSPDPHTFSLGFRLEDEVEFRALGYFDIRIVDSPVGATNHPYGLFLTRGHEEQLGRDRIYTSGPPDIDPNELCLRLLTELVEPGSSILDIGCGAGAYGRKLIPEGFVWHGLEINERAATLALDSGLPVDIADGSRLSYPDNAFDHVLLIEVIEHVVDPSEILAEAARVAQRSVIVSVPNSSTIPLMFPDLVVPWHMLEADHKHFFSSSNLKSLLQDHFSIVETIPYGELPRRTAEGATVYNHLLAVCRV